MNVLIIFNDQHQRDILGAYGNPLVETPNLDRLAAEGVIFDNAICPQPVCTPSRGSLMTGTYPHTHGSIKNSQPLPASIPTIGELLGGAGYNTGYVGKWHLGDEVVPQRGFEAYWRSIDDVYTDPAKLERDGLSSYHQFLTRHGRRPKDGTSFGRDEACRMPEELSKPAFIGDYASAFLRAHGCRRPQDPPFLLVCNFLEPHPPYFGATDNRYDPADIPMPANHHTDPLPLWPERTRAFQTFSREGEQSFEQPKRTEADWRDLMARYYGLAELTDRHIGRILATLDEVEAADDTLVLFTADHGDMMGSHGIYQKGLMLDESLRVPLLARLPRALRGAAGGRHVAEVVNLVDVVPTILELAGQPAAAPIQGRSLAPLLTAARADDPAHAAVAEWNGLLQNMHAREPVFANVTDFYIRCVRTRDWKLSANPGDTWELYDLAHDPGEMQNVLFEAGNRGVARELFDKLRGWQSQTGDTIDVGQLPDSPATQA